MLTAALIAVFYAAWKLAGLPFVPFDVFDWMTRVLPGPVISFGIHSMVTVIRALHVGPTSVVAKAVEQAMGIAGLFVTGIVGRSGSLRRPAGAARAVCVSAGACPWSRRGRSRSAHQPLCGPDGHALHPQSGRYGSWSPFLPGAWRSAGCTDGCDAAACRGRSRGAASPARTGDLGRTDQSSPIPGPAGRRHRHHYGGRSGGRRAVAGPARRSGYAGRYATMVGHHALPNADAAVQPAPGHPARVHAARTSTTASTSTPCRRPSMRANGA